MADWFNTSWSKRKKITVPASQVGSDLTAFTPHYTETSAIVPQSRRDGFDLLVTASDGTTQLPHVLTAFEPMLTALGVWTWFSSPQAALHNGVVYTAFVRGTAAIVASVNAATGAYAEFTLKANIAAAEIDDHDNPSVTVLQVGAHAGKILCCYSGHNQQAAYSRRSTAAESVAAFDAEVTIAETLGGGVVQYTYSNVFEFEDGTIRRFFRDFRSANGTALEKGHRYMESSDSGASWGASVEFFIEGGATEERPYSRMFQNPSELDRIDFAFNILSPNEGSNTDIVHFYYNYGTDTYHNSDGTTITESVGTSPLTPADLSAASLVWDASVQGDRAWVWDIKRDAVTDDIGILFAHFEAGSIQPSLDHRLIHAYKNVTPDTAWARTEVAAMGQSIVYMNRTGTTDSGAQPYYSGGGCFSHASASNLWDVYASVPSGDGHRVINRYTSALANGSDWSGAAINAVNGRKAFRPMGIRSADGSLPSMTLPILYCVGDYSNFANGDIGTTGIACDHSIAQTGYLGVAFKSNLSSTIDNEFYLYWGNALATDQQDASNAHDASTIFAAYGDLTFQTLGEQSLAGLTDATVEVVAESREPGITSNQTLLSNWTTTNGSGRHFLLRIVSGNKASCFYQLTTAGTKIVADATALGADTPYHIGWVLDDAADLARFYLNGAAGGTVAAANTINNNTGQAVFAGTTPHKHTSAPIGEPFAGIVYSVVISGTNRSADWIAASSGMQIDAASFFTVSAQESGGGGSGGARSRTRKRTSELWL